MPPAAGPDGSDVRAGAVRACAVAAHGLPLNHDGSARARRGGPSTRSTRVDEMLVSVLSAKRSVAEEGIAVCDVALEVAVGRAFFKSNPIAQRYTRHEGGGVPPLTPEQSLLHAGRVALGLPADEW